MLTHTFNLAKNKPGYYTYVIYFDGQELTSVTAKGIKNTKEHLNKDLREYRKIYQNFNQVPA